MSNFFNQFSANLQNNIQNNIARQHQQHQTNFNNLQSNLGFGSFPFSNQNPFSSFNTFDSFSTSNSFSNIWSVNPEIDETSNEVLITLPVPGYKRDDLKIELIDHRLNIKGAMTHSSTSDYGISMNSGAFTKSIELKKGNYGDIEYEIEDSKLLVKVKKLD